ncbi:uncharacterized protein LOC133832210 [Humulus lupulus]|uniref:uncharacterized protein LOC133832210 n=1 Tax=Humulus lupulus TaxID=3486 RepID=UPI002B415CA7|nr:uncharacterized protein LOC133832210 [Humulus lupulus]
MEQPIEYEWLPTKCSNCKKLGHTATSCKFVAGVAWRKKESKSIPETDISKDVAADGSKQCSSRVVQQTPQEVSQDGAGPSDICWHVPKRTGNVKTTVPVPFEQSQNSYSVLRENLKNPNDLVPTGLNGVLQHTELERRIMLIWKAHLAQVDVIQENAQLLHCRIIMGDFNAAFNVNDRIGGRPISVKEMEDAQQWLALSILLIKHVEIQRMGVKPFCYYNMWSSHAQLRETMLDSWSKPLCTECSGLAKLVEKLVRLKHVLWRFNWRVMGDVGCNFGRSKYLFQQAQSTLYDYPSNISMISTKREAYLEFSRQEKIYESFLRQKSKITWLRFGDENSSYFHASFKKRKVANRIVSFISADGTISFLGCASRYNVHIDPQSITFGPVLDLDTQLELSKPFSLHDVKVALFSIHSVKSHGPDGYGAGFFKDLWKDIGKEVSLAVLDFFETGKIPKSLNETLLVLIPKVDQPTNAAGFRLITCYLIKVYNRKNSSPRCAMKIDLSKAYDSIDWDFLENLLNALCFPSRFIRWIMVCLRGASYSLVMNGRIQGHFKGGKGLRQGDPISPMLFVIVMDYLTRILIKASKEKGFIFHPMCKSLNLVNLCFADDLLIFCKTNSQSVQILHRALAEFQKVSGLSINHNKSHIYFGGLSKIAKAPIGIPKKIPSFFLGIFLSSEGLWRPGILRRASME